MVLIAGAAYLMPRLFEQAPDQVAVPNVIGKNDNQARSLIGDAGLRVGPTDRENSDTVKAGKIIRQSPDPDQYVDPDTPVSYVISLGKPEVQVPFVIGQNKDDAKATLVEAGFQVTLKEVESDEDKGTVISTSPAQGETVAADTMVVVSYSDGPEKVPDVVGMQQADAENAIKAAGFVPRVFTTDDTTEPKGTVIDQSPSKNEPLSAGSTVTIQVSSFVEPSETNRPSRRRPARRPATPRLPDARTPGAAGGAGQLASVRRVA